MIDNPLRRGLADDRTGDACAVVIFGASGDLTRRKLMPALYNLAVSRSLPSAFAVVGEIATTIQALAQTAKDTEQLATSTMAASGDVSSQSGLLTQEIRTYLDHARGNLVDQTGSGAARRIVRAA